MRQWWFRGSFVEGGKIVLNINPSAVQNLQLGNQLVELDARFSGTPMHVSVPVMTVLAIYARENGKGMVLPTRMMVGMSRRQRAGLRMKRQSGLSFGW